MSAVGTKRKESSVGTIEGEKDMDGTSFNCSASAIVELERRVLANGTKTTAKDLLPVGKLLRRFRFVEQAPDLTLQIRLSQPRCKVSVSPKGSIRVLGASSSEHASEAIQLVMTTLNTYCRQDEKDQPWVHFVLPSKVTSHWKFHCQFEVSLAKMAEQYPQYVIYNVDHTPKASIKIGDRTAELTQNGIIICRAKDKSTASETAAEIINLAATCRIKRAKLLVGGK